MIPVTSPTPLELWNRIKKEITGIQLLWEVVNGLYFQPGHASLTGLPSNAPLVFPLIQTALVESLLMRMSRLMDPPVSGKGDGRKLNLSLKRLVDTTPYIAKAENQLRGIWDGAGLKDVRDKYLSHNDLHRALTVDHTINIPLQAADIEALQALASGLREFRRSINHKLADAPYLDHSLDFQVSTELKVLGNMMQAGELFFKLLPDQDVLQHAWYERNHQGTQ